MTNEILILHDVRVFILSDPLRPVEIKQVSNTRSPTGLAFCRDCLVNYEAGTQLII